MKKVFAVFIFVVFFNSLISGEPTITITSPGTSTVWQSGTQYSIIWTNGGTGNQPAKVKIRLFDSTGSQKLLEITNDTNNDGLFLWTIPSGYTPGFYTIKVRSKSTLEPSDFSVPFEIVNPQFPQDPKITVDVPDGSLTWDTGKSYDIKWTNTGSVPDVVKITLHDQLDAQPVFTISTGVQNSGIFPWTISKQGINSGSYYIKVSSLSGSVSDFSNKFDINKKPIFNPGSVPLYGLIKIVKPSVSSKWYTEKLYMIKWKNNLTKGKHIKIQLFDSSGNNLKKTITTLPPLALKPYGKGKTKPSETSSYGWLIPDGTSPGDYRIKISRVDGAASGNSEIFEIRGKIKETIHKVYGVVSNHCKRHYWVKGGQAALQLFANNMDSIGCILNSTKNARVGYANHLIANQIQYYGFAYRSFIYFNMKKFQQKGIILSAKLKYHETHWPPAASCSFTVYRVNNSFTDGFNVNAEYIGGPDADIKGAATLWLDPAKENLGIMLVGPDETFQHNNNVCQLTLNNIYLEVKFLGVL